MRVANKKGIAPMTPKPKYPHVIKNLDKIIKRLLTEEITMAGIAVEYKATRSAIHYHVQKKATITQYEKIKKRGPKIAGRSRWGVANNPTGGKAGNAKIKAFVKIYADLLSPVKYRIVRPESILKKGATFKVQAKLDDGIWYNVDILTCENDACSLLERLYLYDTEHSGDLTDLCSYIYQESV